MFNDKESMKVEALATNFKSSLEIAHEIQKSIYPLVEIANNLSSLGIPAGEDMHIYLDNIHLLAKACADKICMETNDGLIEAQQQTGKMLEDVLGAILDKGDE